MRSIPHLAVTDMGQRTFIADSTRIARTWREGLLRQAQRGREAFIDRRTRGSHLFEQLDQAGLRQLTTVNMSWGEQSAAHIIDSSADELTRLLRRTARKPVPARLRAVDVDIDVTGEPLP